jgi:hypothetical protein
MIRYEVLIEIDDIYKLFIIYIQFGKKFVLNDEITII